MKSIIFVISILVGILQVNAQEHFYYYKGNKEVLAVNTQYAFISTINIVNQEQLATLLPKNAIITKFEMDIALNGLNKIGRFTQRYWAEIQFTQKLTPAEYEQQLSNLQKHRAIETVSPYFSYQQEEKVGLSNYFLVKLKEEADLPLLEEKAKENNSVIVGRNKYMPLWFTLTCTQQSSKNALALANIFYQTGLFEYAEPDLMVSDNTNSNTTLNCVNDPLFYNQWGHSNTGQNGGTAGVDVNACEAWNISTGTNVIVAVLDQGIEINHPDLSANIFGSGFDTESGTSPSQVLDAHGTPCAGIIGAVQNNLQGISGISPNCKLMSISNSLDPTPNSRQKRADGINWAVLTGASIISNSWSSSLPYTVIDDAITNALTNGRGGLGTIIVFASGNKNVNGAEYPSNSNPNIICVGAIDKCGIRSGRIDIVANSCDPWCPTCSPGSSYGAPLDVVAPGTNVVTTDRQDTYGYNDTEGTAGDYFLNFGGTSAACPHVAGVAALILAVNPCLTHQQVSKIIELSAQKLSAYSFNVTSGRPNGGWNNEVGYGLVDAHQAVLLAQTLFLQNMTETSNVTHYYLGSIRAGSEVTNLIPIGNYTLSASSNVDIKSTQEIIFEPGFVAQAGSICHAHIDLYMNNCNSWAQMRIQTPNGTQNDDFSQENSLIEKVSTFSLHPNPATDQLSLSGLSEMGIVHKVEVLNINGQSVYEQKIGEEKSEIELNVSQFPKGIYILKVDTENGQEVKKFVKE